MANGGPGVVVPGCPACRKRLFTKANFMDHLADDVLPAALDSSRKRNQQVIDCTAIPNSVLDVLERTDLKLAAMEENLRVKIKSRKCNEA